MCQNHSKSSKAPKEGAFRGAGGVIWCDLSQGFGTWYATEIIIPTWSSQPFGLQTHPARPLPVARSMIAVSFRRKVPLLTASLLPDASKWSCQIDFKAEYDPPAWHSLTLDFHCYIVYLKSPLCFHFPSLPCRGDRWFAPPGLETANSGGFKMILSNHPGVERISIGFAWFCL